MSSELPPHPGADIKRRHSFVDFMPFASFEGLPTSDANKFAANLVQFYSASQNNLLSQPVFILAHV